LLDLQSICDAQGPTRGAAGMVEPRRCPPRITLGSRRTEDWTLMDRPVVGGVSVGASGSRRRDHADLAMNVLQYGTALLAILVVTLLAIAR